MAANPEMQTTLWQLKGVVSDMDSSKQKEINESSKKIIKALKKNLEDKDNEAIQLIFSLAMMQVMIDLEMELV